jgi:hypothetical protein
VVRAPELAITKLNDSVSPKPGRISQPSRTCARAHSTGGMFSWPETTARSPASGGVVLSMSVSIWL